MFGRIVFTTAFLLCAGTAAALTPLHDGAPLGSPGSGISAGSQAATPDAITQDWVADSLAAAQQGKGRVLFDSGDIVSVLREDPTHGEGADSVWLEPVNFDQTAGRLVSIQALFGRPEEQARAYAGLAEILRAAAVEQVWGGSPHGWATQIREEVQPDPMYLSTFTFVPSTMPGKIGGIAWHFAPDVIAPAGRGIVSVTVPQEKLRDIVMPGWRDRFGGEPAGVVSARSAVPEGMPL